MAVWGDLTVSPDPQAQLALLFPQDLLAFDGSRIANGVDLDALLDHVTGFFANELQELEAVLSLSLLDETASSLRLARLLSLQAAPADPEAIRPLLKAYSPERLRAALQRLDPEADPARPGRVEAVAYKTRRRRTFALASPPAAPAADRLRWSPAI